MPHVLLQQAGLNPNKDFKNVAYSGAHDATVIIAMLALSIAVDRASAWLRQKMRCTGLGGIHFQNCPIFAVDRRTRRTARFLWHDRPLRLPLSSPDCPKRPAAHDRQPEPDDLAADIIENLEAGLNSFRLIANTLQ